MLLCACFLSLYLINNVLDVVRTASVLFTNVLCKYNTNHVQTETDEVVVHTAISQNEQNPKDTKFN